jgi:hypothetical protein
VTAATLPNSPLCQSFEAKLPRRHRHDGAGSMPGSACLLSSARSA